MLKGITVRSLLSLLEITVYKGKTGQKLETFSANQKTVFWPSFILISLATWLASISFGTGVLGLISTNFPAEEDGRFTVLLTSCLGILGVGLGFFFFSRFKKKLLSKIGIAIALGSEYLFVMGIAGEGYSLIAGTVSALILLLLLLRLFTDAVHQIGSAVIFCIMLTFTVSHYAGIYLEPVIIILTLPIATACLFYPIRSMDLRPLAMVFILTPLIIAFVSVGDDCSFTTPKFASRVIYMALYAFMLYLLYPTLSVNGRKFLLLTFIPVFLFSVLTSSGISASFFVVFMAYMLGSRLVMSCGIIANIIFTILFYCNLEASLETKAGLLLLSSLIMFGLIVWLGKQKGMKLKNVKI